MWTGDANFILNQHFCFQQPGYLLEILRSLSQDVPVSCFLEAVAPHRPCLSTLQGAGWGWRCWDSEPCWRQKYCWAAHADKFMERLWSKNCSVGSSQLGNEIRSQFSNPLFQNRENEPAESFLREPKQRPRQRKDNLVPNCCLPVRSQACFLSRWGWRGHTLMELVVWKVLSLSEGKGT